MSGRPLPARALRGLVAALASVLLLTGCSVYDFPLPGGPSAGDNPIHVVAKFRDVLDLVPQSTVKVNDVSVGKITEVKLKGYVAEVTMALPRDTKLPDNATAQIRQTSLLGEKFVSLAAPSDPSDGRLSDGDVIGLDRTGRNPEVEEVFSALALLLNGGGVAQLQTIAHELNTAMGGREDKVRSVLEQISQFMGQLDQNKAAVVAALENTNRLAGELRSQDTTIKRALDDIPAALKSVNGQRADLVKLLRALTRLSDVGVRVIRLSKDSTINSLRSLAPVLTEFAKAGDAMPKSLQVFLTYPFVDAAVGNSPRVARNLHMGDYTNLSVNLNISLAALPKLQLPGLPSAVCKTLDQVRAKVTEQANQIADDIVAPLPKEVRKAIHEELVRRMTDQFMAQAVKQCRAPDPDVMRRFAEKQLKDVINALGLQDLLKIDCYANLIDKITQGATPSPATCPTSSGDGTIPIPTPNTRGLLPGGNGRAQLNSSFVEPKQIDPFGLGRLGIDPGIGTMLLQGVAEVR